MEFIEEHEAFLATYRLKKTYLTLKIYGLNL